MSDQNGIDAGSQLNTDWVQFVSCEPAQEMVCLRRKNDQLSGPLRFGIVVMRGKQKNEVNQTVGLPNQSARREH